MLGGEESITAGDWATAFWSNHILQVFLGVNVQTATSREPGTAPFHRTLEWLCAQVGDAVTFQVLCSRE